MEETIMTNNIKTSTAIKLPAGQFCGYNCANGCIYWNPYDKDGNGYIIQGDSAGYLHLIDGKEGNIKSSVLLNGNIESSPAVFNNVLVVATRNGTIYGVKVK